MYLCQGDRSLCLGPERLGFASARMCLSDGTGGAQPLPLILKAQPSVWGGGRSPVSTGSEIWAALRLSFQASSSAADEAGAMMLSTLASAAMEERMWRAGLARPLMPSAATLASTDARASAAFFAPITAETLRGGLFDVGAREDAPLAYGASFYLTNSLGFLGTTPLGETLTSTLARPAVPWRLFPFRPFYSKLGSSSFCVRHTSNPALLAGLDCSQMPCSLEGRRVFFEAAGCNAEEDDQKPHKSTIGGDSGAGEQRGSTGQEAL